MSKEARDAENPDAQLPSTPVPVDPAILQKAVMRLRAAARGNGVNPHTILLDGFDGQTVRFQARSLFEIVPTIAEKHVAGRETHGFVCGSEADMKMKVRTAVEKSTIDKTSIRAASDFLAHRKDLGFLVDGLMIKLDRLNKVFIFYNNCSSCHGSGKINCMQCQGAGQANCPKCHAHRVVACPLCRGTKVARQKDGKTGTCPKCIGSGEAPCEFCRRSGKTKCNPCNGSGRTPCGKCAASGVISDIAHVSFEGKTRFIYDKEALPEGLPDVIERIGPDVAAARHADIIMMREKEQAAAQEEYRTTEHVPEYDELVVPFDIGLPYGALGARVGKDVMRGTLFGMHPMLLDYPPFLEKPVALGLDRLNQAAARLGRPRSNLEEALRYRAIGDALVFAATKPLKKAALAMRTRWTLGFRPETCDMMVVQAEKAFINVTTLPRRVGLALGLVLAGAGFGVWFGVPGVRIGVQQAAGIPSVAMAAVDVILFGVLAYIAGSVAQMFVRQATRSLFVKILPPEKAKKIVPRAGKSGRIAFAGTLAVLAAVLYALWMSGGPMPEWTRFYLQLRT